MPGGGLEGRLVDVGIEGFRRGVNAQGFRVALGEAVGGLEALGFRPDLRERVALEGGKLADRRVERVLGQAVELAFEGGDASRGPADAGGNRAHSVGVVRGPIVQVFVAVGDEVFAHHARTLQRRRRKSLADCGVSCACGNRAGNYESQAGGGANAISASPGVTGDSPAVFGATQIGLPHPKMAFGGAEVLFSHAKMALAAAEMAFVPSQTALAAGEMPVPWWQTTRGVWLGFHLIAGWEQPPDTRSEPVARSERCLLHVQVRVSFFEQQQQRPAPKRKVRL